MDPGDFVLKWTIELLRAVGSLSELRMSSLGTKFWWPKLQFNLIPDPRLLKTQQFVCPFKNFHYSQTAIQRNHYQLIGSLD